MHYFAYGSNLNQKQMKERCPDGKPLFTAVLPNYKLVFAGWSRQWRGGVASIKSLRGDRVRGAIYEVTESCLQRLDRHESGYSRLNVTVFGEDDEPIEAITYVKDGKLEDAAPSKEYLAVIQQGLRDWRLF
ncbi:MAG: gamma-glutamylcyclotransferase family protein [Dehalococcoidales bacterium]